ncbi:MAG: thermonuclease family protein [Litoreibacter sp.]
MKKYVGALAIVIIVVGGFFSISESTVVPVADLKLCGARQPNTADKTCISDGDTLWLDGVNIRLKSFDTPESQTNICGSFAEIELAHAATDRLQSLLNENAWTIETFGKDGTGQRRLATVRISGEDVGDILIREGLARKWPDGPEFWCQE